MTKPDKVIKRRCSECRHITRNNICEYGLGLRTFIVYDGTPEYHYNVRKHVQAHIMNTIGVDVRCEDMWCDDFHHEEDCVYVTLYCLNTKVVYS